MKNLNQKVIFSLFALLLTSEAYAWNSSYDCISNGSKKEKLVVSLLDTEVVRTRESGEVDRYYRVTDSTEELIEGIVIGHKVGANARMSVVVKGTMNFKLTQLDPKTVTASVRVGKTSPRTFTCAVGK
ncbi:MAG: hypothetical protein H7301_09590 [Cryobacterium sp.]|nr:hypothetical protein [Oligoflexia bacterium]